MNGEVCCILGVCCPNGSAKQRAALARELKKAVPSLDDNQASEVSSVVLKNFDLAPAGTLTDFKAAIVTHARTGKDEA